MYPDVPYEGHSWPITQHAGVISSAVLRGLLEACSLCIGQPVDATKINSYLIDKGILTANIRSDSHRPDAWRDYQQILSELGLIFSTRVIREICLTPIAVAFIDGSISYEELITLQVLKYQYPNGHKSQISPSLRNSFTSGSFHYDSFTELQAMKGILIRPAVVIWLILYELFRASEVPQLTVDEMQRYVVRCMKSDDVPFCLQAIIEERHSNISLDALPRARRNMADWIKILNNTPLFNMSDDAGTLYLSEYSKTNYEEILSICNNLCKPETFWMPTDDENYKEDWFATYGNIDLSINLIPASPAISSDIVIDELTEEADIHIIGGRAVSLQPFEQIEAHEYPDQQQRIVSMYDYRKSKRGRNLHDSMVNLIAEKCIAKGAIVYSDPKTVDLCVHHRDFEFLVEVKSITPSNFILRLRYAIGQVHQYNYLLPQRKNINRRLVLGFTADIPADSWSIPFITDYLSMDLLTLQSSTLQVRSAMPLARELFG